MGEVGTPVETNGIRISFSRRTLGVSEVEVGKDTRVMYVFRQIALKIGLAVTLRVGQDFGTRILGLMNCFKDCWKDL